MIANTLTQKIGEAMKARDTIRLSTLRMLSSAFNYEKIAKQHELNNEEELSVVRKEAKKRKEAIDAYEKVTDKESVRERIDQETKELTILQEYLPPEISQEEIIKLVDLAIVELNANKISDMGKVIGLVKSKSPGVDGSTLAEIVKQKLLS
ncbi:MAG: GatB/YqeY domain-containing protein [Candidatus Woesebacteria bacterium]|nr:GatB/YqeY domain-containing protein [Candidatus Woesebacteria bacterium]